MEGKMDTIELAARAAMDRFADQHGCPRDYERIEDDGRVDFVGRSVDGRRFGVGYMKPHQP